MAQTLLRASSSKSSVTDPLKGKQRHIAEPGVCGAGCENTRFKKLPLFRLGEIPLNLPLWIETFHILYFPFPR